MADSTQYLRVVIHGVEYLMPSEASRSIEQRDNLTIASESGAGAGQENVTAWYTVQSKRWPAFYLDQDFKLSYARGWQRAVFIDGTDHPVGLMADEVQLLPDSEMRIEPFYPLGPQPSKQGPLFNAAWMRADQVVLVFDPKAVASYLVQLWRGQ